MTDPGGHTSHATWDSLRRRTQAQAPGPLSYITNYAYDANGNQVQMDVENRDKNGTLDTGNSWFTTTTTYTNLNAVATVVEEVTSSTTRTTTFAYDAEGHLTSRTKPMGSRIGWSLPNSVWPSMPRWIFTESSFSASYRPSRSVWLTLAPLSYKRSAAVKSNFANAAFAAELPMEDP